MLETSAVLEIRNSADRVRVVDLVRISGVERPYRISFLADNEVVDMRIEDDGGLSPVA